MIAYTLDALLQFLWAAIIVSAIVGCIGGLIASRAWHSLDRDCQRIARVGRETADLSARELSR